MEFEKDIRELILASNVDELKFGQLFRQLQEKVEQDLIERKKEVRDVVVRIMSEDQDEESSESEDEAPKKKSKGGYNKEFILKSAFASFLGVEACSRPVIVKRMWVYIKEKELQDPKDKRKILLDDALQAVFKRKTFTMFSMNKFISDQLMESGETGPIKKESKTPSKKKAPKVKKEDKDKKPRKPANHPRHRLSPAMQAIVGLEPLSRQGVTAALWDYIRSKELQNPNDRREIICDDKFSAVMDGQKSVTMFSLNKFISPHLIEKLPKGE